MVALFFLSVALGTAMSGKLAGYYDPSAETPFFLWIGVVAIVVGALVLAAAKPISKLMSGVR
jgi:POT family proton-dependent oligopeptide transporter